MVSVSYMTKANGYICGTCGNVETEEIAEEMEDEYEPPALLSARCPGQFPAILRP
jgi:hypothetical protein